MEVKSQIPIIHKELLDACKRGDSAAQLKIYNLYYKSMYSASLRIVGDPMEAEDIMQESFLSAFDHLSTTHLTTSFGGWLKRIVVNRSMDALKKRKIRFEDVDKLADLTPESTVWSEEEERVEERVTLIKRAMQSLPDKYRTVLSLNLLEGYDHDEISEILGITASTSRAQLSRGKQKLLSIIQHRPIIQPGH